MALNSCSWWAATKPNMRVRIAVSVLSDLNGLFTSYGLQPAASSSAITNEASSAFQPYENAQAGLVPLAARAYLYMEIRQTQSLAVAWRIPS
ncbi:MULTISPECIES: hypothetical protein [unclassified Streptomyces]|uniref:hypothetical protein n=1 Tax=unclassified Streptomyces TaxID=2593676 RepID=UPI0037FFFB69